MVLKTKAHRSREEAEAADDLLDYLGNYKADETAKAAVEDKSPDIQIYKEVHQLDSDVMHTLRLAGKVLADMPKTVELWGKLQRARAAATTVPSAKSSHRFEWNHSRQKWVCNRCRRTKKTARAALDKLSCKPLHSGIENLVQQGPGPGHQVWSGTLAHGPPLLACFKCGAFAQYRVRNLSDPCHPVVRSKSVYELRKRKHPDTGERILRWHAYHSGKVYQPSGHKSRKIASSVVSSSTVAVPPCPLPVPSSAQPVPLSPANPSQVHPVRLGARSSHPGELLSQESAPLGEPRKKKPRPDPSLSTCGCGSCIVCDLFAQTSTALRPLQTEATARAVHYNPMDDPEASLATPQESDQEEW